MLRKLCEHNRQTGKIVYLYSSLNIIRVIKSRRMTGYVGRMGEIRNAYTILVEKIERNITCKTQA
jgi:hypothetical protein